MLSPASYSAMLYSYHSNDQQAKALAQQKQSSTSSLSNLLGNKARANNA